jgi:hypothetical protein
MWPPQTKSQVYSNGGDLSKRRFLQQETKFDVELSKSRELGDLFLL